MLRYGDREYVMLHLIFIYLMPGEGQPAAYAAMPGEGQPAAYAASDL